MLDRRQRKVRRAIWGGVLHAGLSAVPLWLFELVYLLAVRRPGFESTYEGAVFGTALLMVLLGVAALWGAAQGLLGLAIGALTQRLASRRLAEPRWMALLYSLVLSPVIAVMAAKMFAGRRASQIPGKHLIAIAVGLAGILATYAAARLAIGVRDRFRLRRWGPRQAWVIGPALLVLALGLYVADQRMLKGLYGFFHAGLALGAFICCQLAVAAVYAAWRPISRRIGRLIDPGLVMMCTVAVIAGGAWGLRRISRGEQFRYLAHEHTVIQSKILRVLGGAGVGYAAPPPTLSVERAVGDIEALAPGPRRPDANLLLITVDALRADHLGVYGHARKTSPAIDRWARGAAVFQRGYCPVPHTSFSLTSLMTGTYMYSEPEARPQTMASVLRRFGYKTAGFFPPAVFYIDGDRFAAFRASRFDFEYVKFEFLDAERRVNQAVRFFKYQIKKGQKFFAWIHFFEPHEPYQTHPGHVFGPRAIDRYDSEVAYVDGQIGRLIQWVKKRHPHTIIALTGDHGEAFGEHGSHYHGNTLYEEQVRVPLIVEVPEVEGRMIDGQAQTIDLPVTMLSLADIPVPAKMRGRDLSPWLGARGASADRLPTAFVEMGRKKAAIQGPHKLLLDTIWGYSELYDLSKDPGELENLAGRKPRVAAGLREGIARWSERRRSTQDRATESEALFARARQRDPGAVAGLIRLARRGTLAERREALGLLSGLRAEPARPVLLRALSDQDPGLRLQATVGAALLGHKPSLAALDPLLERPDLPPAMRRDALIARARAGDRGTTAALTRILDRTEDIYERVELIELLGDLGDPSADRALRAQMKTLRTRRFAIEAAGRIGARTLVPELIAALRRDRFISWRAAAARSLGQIRDRRAIADLQLVVRRELEPDVVAHALEALGRLDALEIRSLPALAPGGWRCKDGGCELSLPGASCGDARAELLLLVEQKKSEVTISCGGQQLGKVDQRRMLRGARKLREPPPAALVSLAGAKGELVLRSPGKPPAVRFAAIRPIPLAPGRSRRAAHARQPPPDPAR